MKFLLCLLGRHVMHVRFFGQSVTLLRYCAICGYEPRPGR